MKVRIRGIYMKSVNLQSTKISSRFARKISVNVLGQIFSPFFSIEHKKN